MHCNISLYDDAIKQHAREAMSSVNGTVFAKQSARDLCWLEELIELDAGPRDNTILDSSTCTFTNMC